MKTVWAKIRLTMKTVWAKIGLTIAWWAVQVLAFAFSSPLLGMVFKCLYTEVQRDTHTYLQEVWTVGCGIVFVLLGFATLIMHLVMCVIAVAGTQYIWGGKDALP